MKQFRVTVNGQAYDVVVEEVGNGAHPITPKINPPVYEEVKDKVVKEPKVISADKTSLLNVPGEKITAPMPGAVVQILVHEGQEVKQGEVLLILEAMKMENEIVAPLAGSIKQIAVHKDATVKTGDLLVIIE
ncbi:MAG: biotin/lipoyl-binding protein [Firmicutes bacterium]|nr:biotin/lipoyl-binding protein [Bacillota bacterium]